jgi:hypothetical protein
MLMKGLEEPEAWCGLSYQLRRQIKSLIRCNSCPVTTATNYEGKTLIAGGCGKGPPFLLPPVTR